MWLMQALFEDKVGAVRIFFSPMPNDLELQGQLKHDIMYERTSDNDCIRSM